jgi:hypothetical protein
MLVTHASGSPYAIFLTGQHQFAGFECSGSDSWKGVLIPNVSIEIDEGSIFDARDIRPPLGALVREHTQLSMVTRTNVGFWDLVKTHLIGDLPPCRQDMAAGFAKWQIILGEGTKKRELKHVEVAMQDGSGAKP